MGLDQQNPRNHHAGHSHPRSDHCFRSSCPTWLRIPARILLQRHQHLHLRRGVPAFTEKVTPVTLAVKEVVDNDYCFDRVLTVCEETSTTVDREICTYEYEREDVIAPCTTTQVTYDEKSETMKVTACGASGYGSPGYGHGEHQYCREEYQTQA